MLYLQISLMVVKGLDTKSLVAQTIMTLAYSTFDFEPHPPKEMPQWFVFTEFVTTADRISSVLN